MAEDTYYVGEQARLTATFTLDGTPADPTAVTFEARNPSDEVIDTLTPDSEGGGVFAVKLPVTESGLWHYRFVGAGVVDTAIPGAFYALSSVFDDSALLVSREYAKFALSIDDDENDISLDLALHEASDAVRTYTHRTFESVADTASSREFDFGEGGITVIDDFQHNSIISVELQNVGTLGTDLWVPAPRSTEFPVGYWIETNTESRPSSPEMGFTRNEDVLARDSSLRGQFEADQKITVTARWGWPRVPRDVQRATIWTAAALRERPSAYLSESIAGYSRTQANPLVDAVPRRAQSLLDPFVREG